DVLNVLVEGGFATHIRGRSRRGWGNGNPDGDANIGFGNAAVSLRNEMEVGGVRGRNGLRPVEVDVADTVDGDAAGVLAAPVEDDGLAEIDGDGIRGDGGGGSRSGRRWGWTKSAGIYAAGLLMAARDEGECGEGSGQGQAFADSVVRCAHQISPANR